MRALSFTVFESSSAAARLDAALAFLRSFSPSQPVTILAATRGAADDLARRVAIERGATIGLARYSLTQLAARVAAARLAGRGIAPATALGSEAVAARVAFDASQTGTLTYFDVVANTPGFPRALAQTIGDLRAAGTAAKGLIHAGGAGADLFRLLRDAEREFLDSSTADRTRLFETAADAVTEDAQLRAPLLLLDPGIGAPCEERFVAALLKHATAAMATVPRHDVQARAALEAAGGLVEEAPDDRSSVLGRLRTYLFAEHAPEVREADLSLQFFSAPGEGREAVEIARRLLAEARRGVRFDEMAVLLRAPQHYQGLLEHALQRAGVPAWFERGMRRPHPAGRAFLALLACAAERLSARRFAEYLSLAQIPSPGAEHATWVPSGDELIGLGPAPVDDAAVPLPAEIAESAGIGLTLDSTTDDESATLPTPRRWERLLVEASVIGVTAERWRRRLDGLDRELERRQREAERLAQETQAEGIARDRARLLRLREFALPLIEEMAAWPPADRWGAWLDRLQMLAPRVLRAPSYVLRVLADLRPMATVGPASLDEVRAVLADRLRTIDSDPPARRYGRVFVGTVAHARGRTFRIVFVPGLAERVFPQKPSQDPLLGDAARLRVDPALSTRTAQGQHERLLLHLAVGAATERLYVSYPRLEVAEGRPRVPSFYALDVLRGATGRIPEHDVLQREAAALGDPSLAWPAPADPAVAIDDQEHDLAVLRGLLDAGNPAAVRGHAQYILKQNAALKRSVTDRWARAERRWSQYDGITRRVPAIAPALAANRLGARPYSVSALQRFAACPYQFLLGAIYRLQPAEQPQPLQRLDPLTKGSLVHAIQAEFLRALQRTGALPVTSGNVDEALAALDAAVRTVAAQFEEELVPAIPQVWEDELAAIARDLRGWVRHVAAAGESWVPRHFELAFGLPRDERRDPHSVSESISIDGRFTLRGSVDLVEEDPLTRELRVTDHKTGKDRHRDAMTIDGGRVLQPVVYSLAIEQMLGQPVAESRLYFCTSAGGFKVRPVRMTPQARRAGVEALEIVDRAVERGMLAAAPIDGACAWCDFRTVCGPNEEERTRRKPAEWLADLIELRSRP